MLYIAAIALMLCTVYLVYVLIKPEHF
ncbi:MAG: potassium-transporting ATPase subunit F [Kiritimatiellales bacterium]